MRCAKCGGVIEAPGNPYDLEWCRCEKPNPAIPASEVEALVERVESEPLPFGEPAESVRLGRLQVVDELRALLARHGAETKEDNNGTA